MPGPAAVFEMNPLFIPEIRQSPGMLAMLMAHAELAAADAQANAPVLTGAYRDSIHAVAAIEGGTAVARVQADDYKSLWLEFGTKDTPAFAPLTKGAEQAGLHLVGGKGGKAPGGVA